MKLPKLPSHISLGNPLQAAAAWAAKLAGEESAAPDEPAGRPAVSQDPADAQGYWVDFPPKKTAPSESAPAPAPASAPAQQRRQDDWDNYFGTESHSAAPSGLSAASSDWDDYFGAPRRPASRREEPAPAPGSRPGDYFLYGAAAAPAPPEPAAPVSPAEPEIEFFTPSPKTAPPGMPDSPPSEETLSPDDVLSPADEFSPEEAFSPDDGAPESSAPRPAPSVRRRKKSSVEDIRYALWALAILLGAGGAVVAFLFAAIS